MMPCKRQEGQTTFEKYCQEGEGADSEEIICSYLCGPHALVSHSRKSQIQVLGATRNLIV